MLDNSCCYYCYYHYSYVDFVANLEILDIDKSCFDNYCSGDVYLIVDSITGFVLFVSFPVCVGRRYVLMR